MGRRKKGPKQTAKHGVGLAIGWAVLTIVSLIIAYELMPRFEWLKDGLPWWLYMFLLFFILFISGIVVARSWKKV